MKSRRKAFLYILNSGNLYGTERMALATLAGMDDYDVRVVFAPQPSGVDSVSLAAVNAGYTSITFYTRLQFLRGLLPWFLKYRDIDMIGTQVGQAFIAHYLAKVLFVRLRQLQVVHGGTEDAHAYGRKRRLNSLPVCVIAVSEFVRNRLVEYGIRPQSIRVIDNFLEQRTVDSAVPRPAYDTSILAARKIGSTIRVIVVSRLDPIKRIDLLVEAIERFALEKFLFDVYGAGEQLDKLRERTRDLKNIRFHGYVSDVQSKFSQADLFLHLCPVEPFGMVILEAFLNQLLVVVPDAGGAGALVDDGVSGIRFPADDVEGLVRALERVRSLTDIEAQRLVNGATVRLQRYLPSQGQTRYREAFDSMDHTQTFRKSC